MPNIEKMLITRNFNKDRINPQYIVIHDTGNYTSEADAEWHQNHFQTNNRSVSAHYGVDENRIIQYVEDFHVAWHVGDGNNRNGIGNRNSLGIEICLPGNRNKTIDRVIKLTKYLMTRYNIGIDKVVRHYDASGKLCPGSMSHNNWELWHEFKKKLAGKSTSVDFNRDSASGQVGDLTVEEAAERLGIENESWIPEAKGGSEMTRLTRLDGLKTSNPLVPWHRVTAVPPHYSNDHLPSHRGTNGTFFLRIGDCEFFIPPLFIRVNNNTPIQRVQTLRQKESVSVASGYDNRDIEVSLWFNNLEQINGKEVEGPQNKTYYMDGLRSLIAQFKRTPFVPVVNELLNGVYGVYAVTLTSISTSTVPGFPNCLQVNLTMKEFNAHPYIGMPTPALEKLYCWPLFRWYYQQMLIDGETFSRTRLAKIETDNMSSRLRFKMMPEYMLAAPRPSVNVDSESVGFDEDITRLSWIEDPWIWMEEIPMDYDDLHVESVSATVGNIVTNIQLSYYGSPTHQFMGSMDTTVSFMMTTRSRQVLTDLVRMHEISQEYTRRYKDKITTGFIGVENELAAMFGCSTFNIQNLDIQTVPGFPDLFRIQLDLISHNKTQKDNETPVPLAPYEVMGEVIDEMTISKNREDYVNPMILDGVVEDMMSELELYPDLELPTLTILREAVDDINAFREAKGLMDLGVTSKDIKASSEKIREVVIQEEKEVHKGYERDRDTVTRFPGNPLSQANLDRFVAERNRRGFSSNSAVRRAYGFGGVGERIDINTWDAIINVNDRPTKPWPKVNISARTNSRHADVGAIQDALGQVGFPVHALNRGVFCVNTKASVESFQRASKFLDVDGVVGVNTWGELFVAVQELTETIPEERATRIEETSLFVEPDFYIFYPNPEAIGALDMEIFNMGVEDIKSSTGNGMLDSKLKNSPLGADGVETYMQLIAEMYDLGADHGVPAENIINGYTDVPPLTEDQLYKLMVHDNYAYSKRYTMTRAFPTTAFLFVDEGQRVGGTRLWSNFYAYHSVISVDVTKSKDGANEVCKIVLSNIYNSLDTNPSYATAEAKTWWEQKFLRVDQEMLDARKRVYEHMALKPGARVHLRMGYGADPNGLPTTFNGVITEMQAGNVMTIIAQGDSIELMNPMPDVDPGDSNGIFKLGAEPSDLIRNMLSARQGFQAAYQWNGLSGEDLGWAAGSRYGIEHFGYLFRNDENWLLDNFKALFHIGDQGRWSYDIVKNVYKGAPFFDDEGRYRKTTDTLSRTGLFDEQNQYIYLYGKSPWDAMDYLSMANADYITATAPHNFRSTVFFGQPQWLYKYGTRYMGGANLEDRRNIAHYFELIKSFEQVHMIDSLNDIIDNQIIANSNGVTTAVIPTYTEGDKLKSDLIIYADKNIYPENQRTSFFDTTAVQDYIGWETLYTAVGIQKSKRMARSMGLSYLQRSFRDMYKGEIIILGDPAISSHDMVYLTDIYTSMVGPVTVGRVTHSLSVDAGFTTSIKPDLITVTKESGSVGRARTLSAIQMFSYNAFTTKMALHSSATLAKAQEVFSTDKKDFLANMLEGPMKGVWGVTATAAIKFGIIGGPIGWATIILGIVAFQMVDRLCSWLLDVFIGRNDYGITAIPLYYKDEPLLIGVKGHKELLPFQEDSSIAEGKETRMLGEYGQTIDDATKEQLLRDLQNEHQLYRDSYFARRESGVDIFRIKTSNTTRLDFERDYSIAGGNLIGGGGGIGPYNDIPSLGFTGQYHDIAKKWAYDNFASSKARIDAGGWVSIILRESEKHGHDPHVIYGMICTESNARPDTLNRGSTYAGLMAIDIAAHPRWREPDYNITQGCQHLTNMTNYTRKDIRDAHPITAGVTSYNAGQGNVHTGFSGVTPSAVTIGSRLPHIARAADIMYPNQGKIKEVNEFLIKVMYSAKLAFEHDALGVAAQWSATSSAGGSADAVIAEAKKHLGKPYQWGGNGPNSFDCSGFTVYVFNKVGINLPRLASAQQNFGTRITREQLRPGDLVFRDNPATHVGIYIGDGKYIHAPRTGRNISIDTLDTMSTASRVLPESSSSSGSGQSSGGTIKGQLVHPTDRPVNSPFGRRNSQNMKKLHGGIDMAGNSGHRINAAGAGTVIFSSSTSGDGYGNTVVIDHGNGEYTAYCHNSRNRVNKGERVTAGQHIADMGATGGNYSPHLHFEVMVTSSKDISTIRYNRGAKRNPQLWFATPAPYTSTSRNNVQSQGGDKELLSQYTPWP